MEIEQIGSVTQYRFNWIEHVVVNAALKHLDRQRRSGRLDPISVNSATRSIFADQEPKADSHELVRWMIDEDEELWADDKQAIHAPSPEILGQMMDYVSAEIDTNNHTACVRPIGKIVVTMFGYAHTTANYDQPLAALSTQIASFSRIVRSK